MEKKIMMTVIRKSTVSGLCTGLGTVLGMVINENWYKIGDKVKGIVKHKEKEEESSTLDELFKDA